MKRLTVGLSTLLSVLLHCATLHAQWVQTKGPYGGIVNVITSIGDTMFAGTGGGVYVSTDEGTSWSITSSSFENTVISSLIADGSKLYAAEGLNGILLSLDEGASWRVLDVDVRNATALPLVATGTSVLVGARGEVFRTTDDGESWTNAPVDVNPIADVSGFITHGQYVFAIAPYNGLFRSSDDGLTWTQVFTGDGTPQHGVATPTSIILTYEQGIRRSTDNGLSWIPYSALGLTKMVGLAARGTTLYASTKDSTIYRSTDDGVSWSLLNTNLPRELVHAFAFSANNIFAMTDKGVHRSADGLLWSKINDGMQSTTVSTFAANDRYVFAGTFGGGVYRSSDNGASWRSASSGLYIHNIYSIAVHDEQLFVGTEYGVWVSTNDGSSWQWQNAGLDLSPSSSFVTSFISANDVLYAGTSQFGVLTKARGETFWRRKNAGIEEFAVYCLAMKGANLVAGSSGRVATSADYGTTWSVSSALSSMGQFRYLATNNTYFFASTDSGVYRSSDNGITWSRATNGMDGIIVSSLLVHGANIFATTYNDDVYVSTDNGDTWTSIGAIRNKRSTFALKVIGTDLLVGVRLAGVWRRALGEVVSSVSNETNEPVHAASLQAYPNPADAASTSISFSLQHSGLVTLNIFNTRGERIATLLSEHLEAGPHTIEWMAVRGAVGPGGLYYVQMHSGGVIQTTPLILLK